MLHVRPCADKAPTIARRRAFIQAQGYVPHGRHHEIYLGDTLRAAPDKLKTVLRHPVRRKA